MGETNEERNLEMNRKGGKGLGKRGNGLGKWELGNGDKYKEWGNRN